MTYINILENSKEATKDIINIVHFAKVGADEELNEYAIERLGAIINTAEFERDLLKDIQKNKPKINLTEQ